MNGKGEGGADWYSEWSMTVWRTDCWRVPFEGQSPSGHPKEKDRDG